MLHVAVEIKSCSPWFFNLRALINERPSIVHTGLGNNDSTIDASLLIPGAVGEKESSPPGWETYNDDEEVEEEGDSDALDVKKDSGDMNADATGGLGRQSILDDDIVDSEEDMEDIKPVVPAKRKAPAATVKKTTARPGISVPAAERHVSKKSKTPADRFADVSKEVAKTSQSKIELKKVRSQGAIEVKIATVKAQAEVKIEKNRMKMELMKAKMAHELSMAQLERDHRQPQAYAHNNFTNFNNAFSQPVATGSMPMPTSISDLSNETMFGELDFSESLLSSLQGPGENSNMDWN